MKEDNEDLIELLANEDFKKWVLTPTYERDLFWNTWVKSNPEKEALVHEAREFILSARYRRIEEGAIDKSEVLYNIIRNTPSGESEVHRKSNKSGNIRKLSFYRVAAAILLLAAFLGWGWSQNFFGINGTQKENITWIEKSNLKGVKTKIRLPDGSNVSLNSESSISYREDYGKTERVIKLKGEAFFEVKQDIHKPFKVISEGYVTTALGTSFNINAYSENNSVKVSLKTGKVNVERVDSEAISERNILYPGEGFVIDKSSDRVEKVMVDPLVDFGWKDGILIFRDSSLEEVVKQLERWYGVRISVEGEPDKEWHIEGKFENESLEQLLRGLSFTYDIEFLIHGKNVELKFN